MRRIYILALAILLTGCGESVTTYKNNERHDAAERSIDKRLQDLEDRVLVLEKRQ